MTDYRPSREGIACVSSTVFFRPITPDAPIGQKLILLTSFGVAIIGQLPMLGAVGWHPLPAVPDGLKLHQHTDYYDPRWQKVV